MSKPTKALPPAKGKTAAKPTAARAGAKASPGADAIEVVLERGAFFASGIRQMKFLCAGLGVLALISTGLTYTAVTQKTEPAYFVAYEDGRLAPMIPMSQPNHSQQVVAQWLTHALTDTFDFHFGNIEQELNDAAAKWFTQAGADALIQTWVESGNYEAIVKRKMFVQLVVKSTPILVDQTLPSSGQYMWRFQVPAVLTFRTETREFTNQAVFTVDVSRRSVLEDPKGLGISKIVMSIQK